MSNAEKLKLRQKKRRKITKPTPEPLIVQPISSVPPAPLSPPSSPSPDIPHQDTTPQPSPQQQSHSPIHIDSDPSPTLQNPQPSHEQPSNPPLSNDSQNQLSFWPIHADSTVPNHLYNCFNLPLDDAHFDSTNANQLIASTSMHMGRALGAFSRLLLLKDRTEDQTTTIQQLRAELHQTQDDLYTANVQLNANDAFAEANLLRIAEQDKEIESLQQKLDDISKERNHLLEERTTHLTRISTLTEQNQHLSDQVFQKSEALHETAVINKLQDEEIQRLKITAAKSLEDQKFAIIEEYKRSNEMKEAVAAQFGEGYAYAKKKIQTAGTNPTSLGFSSEEEEEEPNTSEPSPSSNV